MEENTIAARQAGTFGLAMQYGGWVFALFLAIGLLIGSGIAVALVAELSVLNFGQEAIGVVDDLGQETRGCGKPGRTYGHTCTSYRASVRFEANGKSYSTRHSVDETYWNKLARGDRVKLRFLEMDPRFNRLEGARQLWPLGIGVGGGLLFAAAGGIPFSRQLKTARRLIYLRSHGQRRRAKVTEHEKLAFVINRRQLCRIAWLDTAGGTGESRGQWLSRLPEVGAEITIYVDPEGKLAPAWEGDWA